MNPEQKPITLTKAGLGTLLRKMGEGVRDAMKKRLSPLEHRLTVLERRCAVLERTLSGGERSIGSVQSEQLEEVLETLRQPIVPVKDAKGVIVGAKRVPKLP
jgi:hypothetical protein